MSKDDANKTGAEEAMADQDTVENGAGAGPDMEAAASHHTTDWLRLWSAALQSYVAQLVEIGSFFKNEPISKTMPAHLDADSFS